MAYTSNKSRWLLILAYGVALAMSSGMHQHLDCHGSGEENPHALACGSPGTHIDSAAPERAVPDSSNCVACHFLSQPALGQADPLVIETPARAFSDRPAPRACPVGQIGPHPARGPPIA